MFFEASARGIYRLEIKAGFIKLTVRPQKSAEKNSFYIWFCRKGTAVIKLYILIEELPILLPYESNDNASNRARCSCA